MNTEEILKALKLIQSLCGLFDHCKYCPLYQTSTESCGVKHIDPVDWDIHEWHQWRAFK